MIKRKSLRNKENRYGKYSRRKSSRILKGLLTYTSVATVGFFSLFFLFPEITILIPSEAIQSFTVFCENVGNSIIFFFTSVITNRIFLIVLSSIATFAFIILLLPYRTVENSHYYTLKKIGFPYYRNIVMLAVYSSSFDSSKSNKFNTYLNKIHLSFLSSLLLKLNLLSLLYFKNGEHLNILFPVVTKGFNLKKANSKTKKQIDFIANSFDNHYGSKIRELSVEHTRNLFTAVNKMQTFGRVNLSSDVIGKFNLADQFYNILLRNDTGSTCLLIKTEKKGNGDSNLATNIDLYSENRETESHLLNSCGLSKKTNTVLLKKRHQLSKLLFSSTKSRKLLTLEDTSSLFHIPLNYQGGPFSLRVTEDIQNISPILKNQNLMVVGKTVEGEDIGKDVTINVNDLLLNLEIFGMIGRGKTKLVSSLLKQILDYKVTSLVFDIKGEYARTFVDDPRVEIYTVGKPRPLCINLFDTIDDDDVHNTLLIIEEMMMSSNQEFTPAMKNLFETALFLTHQSSKRNIQTFVENIFKAAAEIKSHTSSTYLQQTIDAVLNRLNFIFNPINFEILGTTRTTLDLSLLDNGKSIILDLSQFQKRAARPSDIFLICNLILKMLYRYASAKESTNKLRYVVVLEEAINIIPNFYHSESSASLITSENNFLLGRSLGIGHITISQLWSSVSSVVHGNSATKIIFRSSEKAETIGKAINLAEDEISKIQRLPTQHCFIFFENSELPLKIKTLDLIHESLRFTEYRSKLVRKYGRSVFPLLYNNFIEMRTSLYQKYNIKTKNSIKQGRNTETLTETQSKLEQFRLHKHEESLVQDASHNNYSKDVPNHIDFVDETDILPDNLICEQLCPDKNNSKDCIKYNIGAKIIKTSLTKNCSSKEIAFLLDNPSQLLSIVKDYAEKRNLEYDNFLAFCTVKSLTLDLISSGILSFNEAYTFLKQFSPQTQKTLL